MKREPQPETLTFFLDKCLGRHVVANALRQQGCAVELLTDHFPPSAADTEWLPQLRGKGWVLLTKDGQIQFNQLEVESLLKARVATFALSGADLLGPDMARAYCLALPTMRRMLAKYELPFVARVSPGGIVSNLTTNAQLLRRLQDRQTAAENIEAAKAPPEPDDE